MYLLAVLPPPNPPPIITRQGYAAGQWVVVEGVGEFSRNHMSNTNIKLFLAKTLDAMAQALLQSDGTQGKAYNPPSWRPLRL